MRLQILQKKEIVMNYKIEDAPQEFLSLTQDILQSTNFQKQKAYIQHGTTTLYEHVSRVALRCYYYAKAKNGYDLASLVRGALLHDYFLYDWHIYDHKNGHERLHGFKHPAIAVRNASKEFNLNKKEINIIRSHMWPITLFHMPKSKEAWLVDYMDKVQSIYEMNHKNKN